MEPLDKPRVPQAQTANNIGAGPRPAYRQPYASQPPAAPKPEPGGTSYGAWQPVADIAARNQERRQRAVFGRDPVATDPIISDAAQQRFGEGLSTHGGAGFNNPAYTPDDVNRFQAPQAVSAPTWAASPFSPPPTSSTPASTGPQPFAAPQQRSMEEYNKNNPYSIMNQVTAMQKPAEFKKEFMDNAPGAQGAYTSPFSENEQGQNSVLSTPDRQYDFGKTGDWLDWLKETNPDEYNSALDRFDPQASFAAAQERRNMLRKENNRALGIANGLSLLYGPSRAAELGIM